MPTFIGDNTNNTLDGTVESDLIYAFAGDDVVWGDGLEGQEDTAQGQGDNIDGGAGNDTLYGQGGDDTLYGREGNDQLYGGDGDDQIYGSDGLNGMFGGAGADNLEAFSTGNLYDGGAGDDLAQIYGLLGSTASINADFRQATTAAGITVADGASSNTVVKNVEYVYFYSGEGNDRLIGTDAQGPARFFFTGEGGDGLWGWGGNDSIEGFAGNDYIAGGDGSDTVSGGDGDDVVSAGDGGTVRSGFALDVDVVNGGAGNDHLYGSAGRDSMSGGDGNDELRGYSSEGQIGHDELLGQEGDDFLDWFSDGVPTPVVLDGGPGVDTISLSLSNDPVGTIDLNRIGLQTDSTLVEVRGFERLSIDGSDGDDTMIGLANAGPGASASDDAMGRGGNDYFRGGAGDDKFDGGDGVDVAAFVGAASPQNFALSRADLSGDGSLFEYTVTDLRAGSPEGSDTLVNVETFEFAGVRYSVADAFALLGVSDSAPTIVPGGVVTGSVIEDGASPDLIDTGSFAFDDADASDTHTVSVQQAAGNTLGGALQAVIATPATGAGAGVVDWTYSVANSATQSLAGGTSVVEQFTVTVDDGRGGAASQQVVVTINGANDAATITGTGTGAVTEDTTLTATGVLAVHDVDTGEAVFQAVAPASLNGTYGSFTFNETSGVWTYTLDNSPAATQALPGTASVTDTLTVTSADGTASQTITVTIAGTNDGATITASGGEDTSVKEDDANSTAGGQLTVHDVDTGEAVFQAVAPASLNGTYGSFTFNETSGVWGYTLDNSRAATQALPGTASVTDTLTVTSADGSTTQTLSVTITGADEPNASPVITSNGGGISATVTVQENTTGVTSVTATDADAPAQVLAYSIVSGVGDAARFAINAATGALTFIQAPDFESPSDANADNVYDVRVQVTDSLGAFDTQDLHVAVTNAPGVTVTGTLGNDTINGTPENDTLSGLDGNDVISGDAGNDTLSGGLGSDQLQGGAGNDVFRVSGNELTGDVVNGGDGNDTLRLTGATTLGTAGVQLASVETLDMGGFQLSVQQSSLLDFSSLDLASTGRIVGNNSVNLIYGTRGSDDIDGGGGNDVLRGGLGADILVGGNGADILSGGAGTDVLYGGASSGKGTDKNADTFVFNTALGPGNVDTIRGFEASALDKIALDLSIFASVGQGASIGLDASEFRLNAGGNAVDANDFILYDSNTGNLYYDADGSGAGAKVLFAQLIGATGTLDATDFTAPPVGA